LESKLTRVRLIIDDKEVTATPGATIREAALAAEIYIPAICSHPTVPPVDNLKGAAQVYRGSQLVLSDDPEASWDGCGLCVVEVGGELVRSCNSSVREGMVVNTGTEAAIKYRRERLGEILLTHPHACLTCAQAQGCPRTQCSSNVPEEERCCELLGSCELERVSRYIGVPENLPRYRPRGLPVLTQDPLFNFNTELCIGCLRCVRACCDVREVGALAFVLHDGRPVVGFADAETRLKSSCRFCGACVEVCPTGALLDKVRSVGQERAATLVPCRSGCPAGIDIPRFLRYLAKGENHNAIAVIRERFPLVFAASYACFHPCENACRRGELNSPISICRLKRFLADHDTGEWRARIRQAPPTGKRVAIIGSGPAGLTAGYYLARKGHQVTIHEALPEPGGMLRVGIAEYRYPRELLERDLAEVRAAGVEIVCDSAIDQPGFEQLVAEHDAVFVASGAHRAKRIELAGSDLADVYWGVDFLRERALGRLEGSAFRDKRVAVIGGGNVAMDAARVARRLGVRELVVVSLEAAEELPAWSWEVEEAAEEGVAFLTSWGPLAINIEAGQVSGVILQRCTRVFDEAGRFSPTYDPAETREVPAEAVILAIGQDPSSEVFAACGLAPGGVISTDKATLATKLPKVYAGGDVASGPASLIEAIAMGRQAAEEIDRSLGGDGDISEKLVDDEPLDQRLGKLEGFAALERQQPEQRSAAERIRSFTAIEETLAPALAAAEACRCLRCDLRLALGAVEFAPRVELMLEFSPESVAQVPEAEGVYQLLDAERNVIAIKGVMNLNAALAEKLADNGQARFFLYEEDPMFTKRESELMQQYLQAHGELPSGGDDELDDLF